MPELPEVETSRRGIEPHLIGKTIVKVEVRQPQLRWRVTDSVQQLVGAEIEAVERRGKYLLLRTAAGSLMLHLGMSGSLRVLPSNTPQQKHDHVDVLLDSNHLLRLTDPRRFGACLFLPFGESHPLLDSLGPEPLSDEFDGDYLYQQSRGRRVAIKQLIMDSKQVVGVGNIYANEALFASGIDPRKPADKLSRARCDKLVGCIKQILQKAIEQGGTTLKDFTQVDGKPGYFAQELLVYGKGGHECPVCKQLLTEEKIGQRSTVFCEQCQK